MMSARRARSTRRAILAMTASRARVFATTSCCTSMMSSAVLGRLASVVMVAWTLDHLGRSVAHVRAVQVDCGAEGGEGAGGECDDGDVDQEFVVAAANEVGAGERAGGEPHLGEEARKSGGAAGFVEGGTHAEEIRHHEGPGDRRAAIGDEVDTFGCAEAEGPVAADRQHHGDDERPEAAEARAHDDDEQRAGGADP